MNAIDVETRPRPRESLRAWRAFIDNRDRGGPRSLAALYHRYQRRTEGVPTRQLSRLKKWSAAFDWQGRVAAEELRVDALRRQDADQERAL